MAKYRIVAARPKNASSHLNSQFHLYELNERENAWVSLGWKSINQLSDLMRTGHEVRTGKIVNNSMNDGAPVEIELRITKNQTNYKISDMSDA